VKLLADENNQKVIYGAKSETTYCKHPSPQINPMLWIGITFDQNQVIS